MASRLLLHVEPLPETCLPVQVVRRERMTLVWADPGTLRAEVVAWAMDELTSDEQRALRGAYGQPLDLAVPVDDDLLDGTMATATIPAALRVPERA